MPFQIPLYSLSAESGVALSLVCALSEYVPLSEAPAHSARQTNLEENLPCKHALNVLSLAKRVIRHLLG